MTKDEYYEATSDVTSAAGPSHGWNKRYREALLARGLKLVGFRPEPIGFYIEAPIPTPGPDGRPITIADDPYSWIVPSWIVPVDHPDIRTS